MARIRALEHSCPAMAAGSARPSPASSRRASNVRRTGGAMAFASTSSGRPATTSMCCEDYALCRKLGFRTVRDGLRWHLIEKSPGNYDWSSWLPALEAAEQAGVQVIWDLFHYGSPDHVDPGRRRLSRALHRLRAGRARSAAVGQPASAARLPAERNQLHVLGGRGRVFPARRARTNAAGSNASWCGPAIAAAKAIRERWPDATIIWAEPLDPHRAAQPPPANARATHSETCRACTKPMTGYSGWRSRSLAAIPRWPTWSD